MFGVIIIKQVLDVKFSVTLSIFSPLAKGKSERCDFLSVRNNRGCLSGGLKGGFAPSNKFSSLSPYEGERDKG